MDELAPMAARELADLARACGLAASPADALAAVAALGNRWLPIGAAVLEVVQAPDVVVVASTAGTAPGAQRTPLGAPRVREALRAGHPVLVPGDDGGTWASAAVHWDGAPSGLLSVTGPGLGPEHLPALGLVADAVGGLLHATAQVQQLRAGERVLAAQVHTDALTGLANRAGLTEALRRRLAEGPAAVLVLDVDHLKRVNDRLGHAAGDELLRGVGRAARAVLRDRDSLGRWGGDEFVAVLPGVDLAGATAVAERVRAAVGTVSPVSVGVTAAGAGDQLDAVLDRADRALYEAKRAGRAPVRAVGPDPG